MISVPERITGNASVSIVRRSLCEKRRDAMSQPLVCGVTVPALMPDHAIRSHRHLNRQSARNQRILVRAEIEQRRRQHADEVGLRDDRERGRIVGQREQQVAPVRMRGEDAVIERRRGSRKQHIEVLGAQKARERQRTFLERVPFSHQATPLDRPQSMRPDTAAAVRVVQIAADREIHAAAIEQVRQVGRVVRHHADPHGWRASPQVRGEPRHHALDRVVGHRDGERAGEARWIERVRRDCVPQRVEMRLHRGPQLLRTRGRANTGRRLVEQRVVERATQPAQRVADRRLRKRQPRGRARHVAFVHQRREHPQQIQIQLAKDVFQFRPSMIASPAT